MKQEGWFSFPSALIRVIRGQNVFRLRAQPALGSPDGLSVAIFPALFAAIRRLLHMQGKS
jgi:hypothetical protein